MKERVVIGVSVDAELGVLDATSHNLFVSCRAVWATTTRSMPTEAPTALDKAK